VVEGNGIRLMGSMAEGMNCNLLFGW